MIRPLVERGLEGTVVIVPNEHVVWVTANVSAPPAEGKVYEGWFVDDDGGSGYNLSLGEFAKNGTLTFKEQMVNPYTYTRFISDRKAVLRMQIQMQMLLQPEHDFRHLSDVNSFFLNEKMYVTNH